LIRAQDVNQLLRELPITIHDVRLVQELFPRTIVMDEELLTAHGLEKP